MSTITYVEFKEVKMRQAEEDKVQVAHMPRVIVAEQVICFTPGAIPSEVSGPQGQIIMKPACNIHLPGEKVLVTCTMEEAMHKIKWECLEIKPPESAGVTFNSKDRIITRTIDRPKPEPEEESSIIS